MRARIAVLGGDGIGPEVTTEAVRVLQAVAQKFSHEFEFSEALIGGAAADTLTGGAGEVVFIGGTTSFDTNPAALKNLYTEWHRLDADYATRVDHLRNGGGLNGGTVLRPNGLNPGTVSGDGQADLITAGGGLDFFLRDAADTFAGFNLPGQTVNGVTEVVVNLP